MTTEQPNSDNEEVKSQNEEQPSAAPEHQEDEDGKATVVSPDGEKSDYADGNTEDPPAAEQQEASVATPENSGSTEAKEHTEATEAAESSGYPEDRKGSDAVQDQDPSSADDTEVEDAGSDEQTLPQPVEDAEATETAESNDASEDKAGSGTEQDSGTAEENTEEEASGSHEQTSPQPAEDPANAHTPKSDFIAEDAVTEAEEEHSEKEEDEHTGTEDEMAGLTLVQILERMEQIINSKNSGADSKKFNTFRDEATRIINEETEDKKHEFTDAGNTEEDFAFDHPLKAKLSGLINIYREKQQEFHKNQEAEHHKNLENRQNIIDKLKNLYTHSEVGTNFFKEIRVIKEEWTNAGQVAKSEFKLLNNNYFHHLNQFYQMLDMNKEYLEQEHAHNLEKREHIIARARELENEPSVQKALNELQYLHKLWKEEAEPVSEEFREKTWQEFREISNRIHERRSELTAQIESDQNANLEKKNAIIEELNKLIKPEKEPNHNYWQNAIKRVEELRTEFLKTGSVPRKISNQNWNEFKQILRVFNNTKNEFYKGLKNSQQHNLEEKMKLIQTAKDHMETEDWEAGVPLFKKLQEDWKSIGHVPRSMTNKVWDEFREACNVFFNNYRTKNAVAGDNWKENYKQKKALLEELNAVTDAEGSVEKIEQIKTAWNSIGKVPRDKITINTEFNKSLREKMKLNKIHDYELKEEGLSENQITDKARKIKNQIADLEAEIVKLENNLGFFHNPSRENPLLTDTFNTIDHKKAQLETMRQSLHHIISGE